LQPADAEDVGQDVFRSVFAGLDRFRRDGPGHSFRGWLRAITRSRLGDWWRNRGAVGQGGDGGVERMHAVPEPSDDDEAAEAEILHRRALESVRSEFSERDWQAFWRVVVEEQAPKAVAAHLGVSANSVYLARSRILARLRALLGELGEADPPTSGGGP